jgi:nucleoside-diphosphate-sugar epimerase
MIRDFNVYNEGIKKVISRNNLIEIKNSSILVTGINGMIGSAIVDILNYLNEQHNYNISIIGIARNKNNVLERFKNYKNMEIYSQDLQDKISIDRTTDYIINAASNADPAKISSDPIGTMNTNYEGTKNLLNFGVANKCKRFVYISSGEIYGQGSLDIDSFNENYRGYIDSTNPRSCYPIGKLAAETLCVSFSKQYGIECIIVRPSHTYGPTQKETDSRASSQFVLNVINNNDITMKSEGKQIRSYTYVLDCAVGILIALINGNSCEAYNVANKNSVLSIKEMAELIAKSNNRKVIFDLPTDSEKASYNPVTRSVLNGQKLESIGWIPCYSFEEGISETIKIMK